MVKCLLSKALNLCGFSQAALEPKMEDCGSNWATLEGEFGMLLGTRADTLSTDQKSDLCQQKWVAWSYIIRDF